MAGKHENMSPDSKCLRRPFTLDIMLWRPIICLQKVIFYVSDNVQKPIWAYCLCFPIDHWYKRGKELGGSGGLFIEHQAGLL